VCFGSGAEQWEWRGREGDLKGGLGGFACGLVWEVVSSNQTLELFGRLGFRISMRTGLTAKYGCRVADILHWCECSYLEYIALSPFSFQNFSRATITCAVLPLIWSIKCG